MQLRSRTYHVQKNAGSSEFAVTFCFCTFFFLLLLYLLLLLASPRLVSPRSRSRPDSATLYFFHVLQRIFCLRVRFLSSLRVPLALCFAWMYPTVPPATLEQNPWPRCSANERVPPQQPSASHCSGVSFSSPSCRVIHPCARERQPSLHQYRSTSR